MKIFRKCGYVSSEIIFYLPLYAHHVFQCLRVDELKVFTEEELVEKAFEEAFKVCFFLSFCEKVGS